jgi:hypothetical protein
MNGRITVTICICLLNLNQKNYMPMWLQLGIYADIH